MKQLFKKKHFAVGLLDSSLISGAGLLLNLICGRFLSVSEYGCFITVYVVSTLASVIYSALISMPYTIFSQGQHGNVTYFAGSFLLSLLLGGLLAVVITVSSLALVPALPLNAALIGVLLLYVNLNLLQEFFRRCYYSHRMENEAFGLGVVSYGGQTALLFLLATRLDLVTVFFVLSATTALALLISFVWNMPFWISTHSPKHLSKGQFIDVLVKNWKFGRWLLCSNGLSWIASQFYVLALSMFHGPAPVAQLGAAQLIAASSNPVITAYESMGLPRLSKMAAAKNIPEIRRFTLLSLSAGTAFFSAWGLVFFLFPDQAMRLAFGKTFDADNAIVVRLFSLMPTLWFLGKVFSIGILSLKQSQKLLGVYLASCVFSVFVGFWLIQQWGVVGATAGMVANALILVIGFGLQFMAGLKELEHSKTESLLKHTCPDKVEASQCG